MQRDIWEARVRWAAVLFGAMVTLIFLACAMGGCQTGRPFPPSDYRVDPAFVKRTDSVAAVVTRIVQGPTFTHAEFTTTKPARRSLLCTKSAVFRF